LRDRICREEQALDSCDGSLAVVSDPAELADRRYRHECQG